MAEKHDDKPEPMIQVSEADFKALLARIGDLERAAKTPSASGADLATLVQSISKIAENADRGPIKQIPIAKTKFRTPWNPKGDKVRTKLTRSTYMNGFRLHESKLKLEEIQLLNKLKPGRYGPAQKIVVVEKAGEGDGRGELQLWVPNKTQGDRTALAKFVANEDENRAGLLTLLDKILKEQNAIKLAS